MLGAINKKRENVMLEPKKQGLVRQQENWRLHCSKIFMTNTTSTTEVPI